MGECQKGWDVDYWLNKTLIAANKYMLPSTEQSPTQKSIKYKTTCHSLNLDWIIDTFQLLKFLDLKHYKYCFSEGATN